MTSICCSVLKKLTCIAYCAVKIHEIFCICSYFSRGQMKCSWFYWELIFQHLKILSYLNTLYLGSVRVYCYKEENRACIYNQDILQTFCSVSYIGMLRHSLATLEGSKILWHILAPTPPFHASFCLSFLILHPIWLSLPVWFDVWQH